MFFVLFVVQEPDRDHGYESILFESAGGVARITLNRPDRLNSFTSAMHAELRDALARVKADAGARVLLLTGAGRGFCAGQDLSDRAVAPGGPAVDLGASIEANYRPLVLALRSLPLPVVCAVNGVAAGAGANIALACDIVIAAKSASFIQAFCKIGLIPDSGGTYFLPRLVGSARATGTRDARRQALGAAGGALGAHLEVRRGRRVEAVGGVAARVLRARAHARPRGDQARAPRVRIGNARRRSSTSSATLQRELGYGDDYREGVAAFIAKRAPHFTGR